jgi:DNA-directed RNA polymerase III subunit RPC1
MAHTVKVRPWRTFRFNTCVCTPYNADFDGDEMNVHVPQTLEARAEALTLMGVKENLLTPKSGEPLVSLNQDFLTGSFLLTQRDVFLSRAELMLLCSYMNDGKEKVLLPPPAIVKPMQLWTGKQVYSLLLKPNTDPKWPLVNLTLLARNLHKDYKDKPHMCPRDGNVVIRNSELLTGNLCKKSLGGGSKEGLFFVLIRDHGTSAAASVMSRCTKMISRWLQHRGFSIGISDVTPSANLLRIKASKTRTDYKTTLQDIETYKSGGLDAEAAKSGKAAIDTLEVKVSMTLNSMRGALGDECIKELPYHYNAPLIMEQCGSKGSKENMAQMIALVGQQSVSNKRIGNGFGDRTLPHFPHNSLTPAAKGFVINSFFSGLSATEFFFHTVGGREGLVDTAVKTAETGYMQRRLMKALEDLCANYDGTVRNSENTVVQLKYGDDGLDPIQMEVAGPANFPRLLEHIRNTQPCDAETGLSAQELRAMALRVYCPLTPDEEARIQNGETVDMPTLPIFTKTAFIFRRDIRDFMLAQVKEMEAAVASGLPEDYVISMLRITPTQLRLFLEGCAARYQRSLVEPGTAVGAIGGQSIGEPGTQMTLKTFHFAGMASMNITMGVPRIKEIINAAKAISTPAVFAKLDHAKDEKIARIVKSRIEKTVLGEVASYIKEVFTAEKCYLLIRLNMKIIQDLHLELTVESVRASILDPRAKLKLKDKHVLVQDDDLIRVHPSETRRDLMFHNLQALKEGLLKVVVKGLKDVSRVVIEDRRKVDVKVRA